MLIRFIIRTLSLLVFVASFWSFSDGLTLMTCFDWALWRRDSILSPNKTHHTCHLVTLLVMVEALPTPPPPSPPSQPPLHRHTTPWWGPKPQAPTPPMQRSPPHAVLGPQSQISRWCQNSPQTLHNKVNTKWWMRCFSTGGDFSTLSLGPQPLVQHAGPHARPWPWRTRAPQKREWTAFSTSDGEKT